MSSAPINATATPSKRRWLRFSLRAVLVAIAIIAVLIWIPIQRARDQKRAIDQVERLGGRIQYYFDSTGATSAAPAWLQRLLGEDYFRTVIGISLVDSKAVDRDLECLRSLPDIEELDLWGCKSLTDASLAYIGKLPNLQDLNLAATNITDRGLTALRDHARLQTLWLAGTKISDPGLVDLATIKSLKSLHLTSTEVTDSGMDALSGIQSLEHLDLSDTPHISDGGLVHIGKLRNLKELNLRGDRRMTSASITDAGLAELDALTKLEWLDLDSFKLTDACVEHLLKHPALSSLRLSHSNLTDAGLAKLAALSNLWGLNLDNTEVTDAGLLQLKSFPKLTSIGLGGRNMTDAGIDRLRQLLPQVIIQEYDVVELRPAP